MTDDAGSAESPATPPAAGLAAVFDALEKTDAVGFVHVGDGGDADRRYLTRTAEPSREAAVVAVGPQHAAGYSEPCAIYCFPERTRPTGWMSSNLGQSDHQIKRQVARRAADTPAGVHAVSVLADRLGAAAGAGSLLVPRHIPHDTAVHLERAGYEIQSTTALTTSRAVKAPAEHDCLRAVQRAAACGMDRAHALLAESDQQSDGLSIDGQPVSTRQVAHEIRLALARQGVGAESVDVRTAASDSGATKNPTTPLRAGEPIEITVAPRGPHGYHGQLTRTLVVDSDGGWDRRAAIAVEAGLRAARRHCTPGGSVHTVHAEAVAETSAYGFSPALDVPADASADAVSDLPESTEMDGVSAAVHGTGLSAYEAPSAADSGRLEAGSVLSLSVAVFDADYGRIRLGTLVEVTDEGGSLLVSYPETTTPQIGRETNNG